MIVRYWDKTLLNSSLSALSMMKVSNLTGGNRHCSWLCLSVDYYCFLSFKVKKCGSFSILGLFSLPTALSSTQLNTQGWPSADLWSSVSSLTFRPANASHCLLPRFSTLSPQLSGSPPLALPLPVLCPRSCLRAINSESHRGRIICCLSLNNHCSSWLMFTILKTQELYILFTKSEWSLIT